VLYNIHVMTDGCVVQCLYDSYTSVDLSMYYVVVLAHLLNYINNLDCPEAVSFMLHAMFLLGLFVWERLVLFCMDMVSHAVMRFPLTVPA